MKRLLILFLPLVLLGCGQASQELGDGKITQAEGSVSGDKVDLKDVSLTLSKDWKVFDLAAKDLASLAEQTEKANPGLKGVSAQLMAASRNGMIKMFAFDVSEGDKDFVNNMNVIVIIPPAGSTIEQMEEGSKKEIEKFTGTPAATGKSGAFSTLDYKMNGPDGKPLMVTAYMALQGDKAYTFTFTCRPQYATKFKAKADQVMQSVVLK